MALRDVQDILETALEPFDAGHVSYAPGIFSGDAGFVGPNVLFRVPVGSEARNEPSRFITPPAALPPVVVQPVGRPAPPIYPTVTVDDVLQEPVEVPFIDPEEDTQVTVFETVPGGIYETNRAPTDWAEFYRRYRVLNPPVAPPAPEVVLRVPEVIPKPGTEVIPKPGTVPQEPVQAPEPFFETEEDMAVDWGGVIQQVVGGTFDPLGLGAQARSMFAGVPGTPAQATPRTVTVDTVTGRVSTCRRRRRRRLLTEGDFNDLMRIATLPNKDTVKIALAKAIGRR